MGNSNSVDIPGGGTEGYHVLRVSCARKKIHTGITKIHVKNKQVQENSPASKAGLQAFFDFIVAVNGVRLDRDNDTLKQMLRNGIGEWEIVGFGGLFCKTLFKELGGVHLFEICLLVLGNDTLLSW